MIEFDIRKISSVIDKEKVEKFIKQLDNEEANHEQETTSKD